jgi:hypothetical protein
LTGLYISPISLLGALQLRLLAEVSEVCEVSDESEELVAQCIVIVYKMLVAWDDQHQDFVLSWYDTDVDTTDDLE